ncbi:MAG: arabinan endo,5-alpha-L-arabinosidase [Firmicutes bacterium]|nr:arabinan endo,5-alpha-L-arabinosidase [Bacillota bacterium]
MLNLKRKIKFLSMATLLISLLVVKPVSAAFWELSGDLNSHDPSLIKDGSTWWSPSTGTGLAMKYSSDGLVWHQGTKIFSSELSWWRTYAPQMGTNDVWAPDIKYFNGRYWMYYSVSEFGKNNSAIGLTSCTSVNKGDWRDDGMVLYSKSGSTSYNAIDPNLIIDASNIPWLVFGSWFDGIHIVKLDSSTMKPTGSIYSIAKRTNGIEGACMIYTNGYYYLFASIDKCCKGVNSTYKIVYGRSKSITGPYLDKDGVDMKNGGGTILDSGNSRWIGPGGQYVYKNRSSWVIARHAYDANNNGTATLLINDLSFDSNKWPTY